MTYRGLIRGVGGPIVALIAAAAATGPAPDAATPESPATGRIVGHVEVITRATRRLATAGAYPSRSVGDANTQVTSELDNVVISIDDVRGGAPPVPGRAVIRQTNREFIPHLVAVTAGSTVEFPNDDAIFHNVFSLSRALTFDLGRYPKGELRTETFDTPGIVKVFCHLHSNMSAVVRVFAHPYFAIPGRNGRFEIAAVPAGTWTVSAWHERVGDVSERVVVSAGGTTELSFSLPIQDGR